ncbi:MAG: anaerobic ribonucleoside-triphosphate reductase activating protein, partial [Lachnospiraceae bacterium]|nr:anaerobic ribonucleoside-triphosphate reductase activating protein [Lachnospiraceae bacterium]
FINELKDVKLRWKGSSNQRVINVQASLRQEDGMPPILYCEN